MIAVGSAVIMTSCGKKLNPFQADYFTTNPNPLEVVGERVPATVNGNIPAKFFVKNAVVTVTPTLVYDGTETKSQPYVFQGEKVMGNNPVIYFDNGGTMTIPVAFNYVPEMDESTLYLDFSVTQGNKQYALPRVAVAEGVISTAAMATATTVTPSLATDAFQKDINEAYAADIMFLINVANIRANQLSTDAMEELRNEIRKAYNDDKRVLEEINIKSYASPDGPMSFNTQLAEKRETNTKGYINDQLKKDNITEFKNLTAEFTPEDWVGFKELVSKSNIQDKQLILSILERFSDPEVRDQKIKELGQVFNELAEQILPQLRYSRITASVKVIGKTDSEILAALNSAPEQLTVEEILYAATLTNDPKVKQSTYATAAKYFPNDYRVWNDLGMAQYMNGDAAAAATSFNKAKSLNANAAEPLANLGLIALANQNYSDATKLMGSASNADNIGEMLGTLYLKQGDAQSAVRAFANTKSNNAGLAQILTRDYTKAKNTLTSVANPDADTYYMLAVIGARTNNQNMVKENLQKAVKLDPAKAAKAAKDLEFAQFSIAEITNN
ncbi:MAG: hypothetical protein K2K84_00535 [Muribaculaceae bacterium]|nr:hypothetical protein [Muribaculaceae bacterium]